MPIKEEPDEAGHYLHKASRRKRNGNQQKKTGPIMRDLIVYVNPLAICRNQLFSAAGFGPCAL